MEADDTPITGGEFVTDLISAPDAATGAVDTVPAETVPPTDQPLAWAPQEPAPKKRRLGLWIGIGVGVLVLGAAAASTVLIAPGTTIAGIPVGGLTPGLAADRVSAHLADTEVTLTGAGDDIVVTGADLGAHLDAKVLAEKAFAEHPMWNLGSWMPEPIAAKITLDPEAAERTLRAAVPATYVDPVDAGVVFDAASAKYVTTPSEAGTAIDLDALTSAIAGAVAKGGQALDYPGGPAEAGPAVTDDEATETATSLNTMLGTIGFYVGKERTVPVAPAVAASWLTVVDEDGTLRIEADSSAIQTVVDTLGGLVNRAAVNATNIVDSGGKVLRELTAGASGRQLGDVSTAASDFAEQLTNGNGVYELDVTETAFTTTAIVRRIEVDLGAQRTYLFENDKVVKSYAISSGLSATPTPTGRFRVFGHTPKQSMGCFEGAAYCTKDVPWNTWFAPNIAFHGAYWHNNFGQRMSHGCVNMPVSVAKAVYEWSPTGLEVWVHS